MLQAKVKDEYRWDQLQSGGVEFTKRGWRPVPDVLAEEIKANPWLDVTGDAPHDATVGEEAGAPSAPASTADVSKAAAELAESHGLDLTNVTGSGAGGKIIVADVREIIGE